MDLVNADKDLLPGYDYGCRGELQDNGVVC
jgi:hypothetical protein